MLASPLPPGPFSKPSCHRLRHVSLWVLYLGIRAPWYPHSRQIPRPDSRLRRRLRVNPMWTLGPSRRCVGI